MPTGAEAELVASRNGVFVSLVMTKDHRCLADPTLQLTVDGPGRIRATGDARELEGAVELRRRLDPR